MPLERSSFRRPGWCTSPKRNNFIGNKTAARSIGPRGFFLQKIASPYRYPVGCRMCAAAPAAEPQAQRAQAFFAPWQPTVFHHFFSNSFAASFRYWRMGRCWGQAVLHFPQPMHSWALPLQAVQGIRSLGRSTRHTSATVVCSVSSSGR